MSSRSVGHAHLAWLLFLGALSWIGGACAATVSAGSPPEPVSAKQADADRAPLGVPRGHLPPPGECRIWFPNRPPGQQPPPLHCGDAMANAPAGSWVLYRPDREEVHARVIDARRPGVVVRVRVYETDKGRYLRTERP